MNIDELEAARLKEEEHRAERKRQRQERMRKRAEIDEKKQRKLEKREAKQLEKQEDRKTKRRGKIKLNRLILVILIIVAFLSVVAFGAFKTYQFISNISGSNQVETADTINSNENKTKITTIPLEQKSLEAPIYMLVVGKDNKNPAEADSLFLVAINERQKIVDIIGIPSNSKIESRDKKSVQKLDSIYTSGGIELTKAVVEDMFHIVIPYYAIVDESDFKRFVDVVGAPSLYVEKNMYHEGNGDMDEAINLAQGYQQLSADQTLQYVRYVEANDDFARTQRQERLLKTILAKVDGKMTFTRAIETWRLWSQFDSNISTFDAVKLTFKLGGLEKDNIHYFILPGVKEEIENDVLWSVDPTEVQRIVGITMGVADDENQIVSTNSTASTNKNDKKIDQQENNSENKFKKPSEPGSE